MEQKNETAAIITQGNLKKTDKRLSDVFELLAEAPLEKLSNFLDIGMGRGEILKWLREKGKSCTGTGLAFASYGVDQKKLLDGFGIESVECDAEHLPFPDKKFDGIIMSHVLEHCLNVGRALEEAKRVLSDDGWLFIFVPPHESKVCAGHVSVGWSVGQLMYVLLLNGFDTKNGRFIHYGYNICAFVQKSKIPLPAMRGDKGDINLFHEHKLLPREIANDGFFGDIKSINWLTSSEVLKKIKQVENKGLKKYIIHISYHLSRIMPLKISQPLGNIFIKIGKILTGESINNHINPKSLKG